VTERKSGASGDKVHVHVINLDRSPERLAEFRSVNRHLAGLSRAVAFDGSKLDLAELERQGLIRADIRHPITIPSAA
jgi:hypothetical protein